MRSIYLSECIGIIQPEGGQEVTEDAACAERKQVVLYTGLHLLHTVWGKAVESG